MLEKDDERLLNSSNGQDIINSVELQEFKAEFTSVTNILTTGPNLEDKDKFDLIKFTIKVKAVYEYEWEVYRKPSEIKKNFSDIKSELSQNFIELSGNTADIFTTLANWKDDSFQLHIKEIKNFYKTLFIDNKIYNTLAFKEFFNISVSSFNQNNNGIKPFEGYCSKKADPQCLRTAFSFACKCIEYFFFSQYNLRWIVVKNDCIYYMDKSNSPNTKNIYYFDKDLFVRKEGRDIPCLFLVFHK